jgi:hypothetical protein
VETLLAAADDTERVALSHRLVRIKRKLSAL